jgi:hypothetical protein
MASVMSLDDELRELVTAIQTTPPNPTLIKPATANLAELLSAAPDDPSFDLQSWQRQWSALEAEMKSLTRVNDVAEGGGG